MEALLEEALTPITSNGTDEDEPVLLVVGDVVYRHSPEGITAELESGTVLACSMYFEITSRLVNPETGEAWFRIRLMSDQTRTVYSPAAKGPAGIIKAIQETGEFTRPKLLTPFVEEILAQNWHILPVKPVSQENELADTMINASSVYELFLEFIWDNEDQFDEEKWGKLTYGPEEREVFLTRPGMAHFFEKFSIPKEWQPKILRYWRDRGWLRAETNADGISKRFTRKETIKGFRRRVYVITLPAREEAVAE